MPNSLSATAKNSKPVPTNRFIFPTIFKYAGYGLLSMVCFAIIQFLVLFIGGKQLLEASFYLSIFGFGFHSVIFLLIMVYAPLHYKKINNNRISFGRAFAVSYLTALLMTILSLVLVGGIFFLVTDGIDRFEIMKNNDDSVFGMIIYIFLAGFSLNLLSFGTFPGLFIASIISLIVKNN